MSWRRHLPDRPVPGAKPRDAPNQSVCLAVIIVARAPGAWVEAAPVIRTFLTAEADGAIAERTPLVLFVDDNSGCRFLGSGLDHGFGRIIAGDHGRSAVGVAIATAAAVARAIARIATRAVATAVTTVAAATVTTAAVTTVAAATVTTAAAIAVAAAAAAVSRGGRIGISVQERETNDSQEDRDAKHQSAIHTRILHKKNYYRTKRLAVGKALRRQTALNGLGSARAARTITPIVDTLRRVFSPHKRVLLNLTDIRVRSIKWPQILNNHPNLPNGTLPGGDVWPRCRDPKNRLRGGRADELTKTKRPTIGAFVVNSPHDDLASSGKEEAHLRLPARPRRNIRGYLTRQQRGWPACRTLAKRPGRATRTGWCVF